jgi:hypothetical protein
MLDRSTQNAKQAIKKILMHYKFDYVQRLNNLCTTSLLIFAIDNLCHWVSLLLVNIINNLNNPTSL